MAFFRCSPTRTGLKTGIEKEKQEVPLPKCPEIRSTYTCTRRSTPTCSKRGNTCTRW